MADRTQRAMLSGAPETPEHRELKGDGQQRDYVILSDAERSRGFVRPVRESYEHSRCGARPKVGT